MLRRSFFDESLQKMRGAPGRKFLLALRQFHEVPPTKLEERIPLDPIRLVTGDRVESRNFDEIEAFLLIHVTTLVIGNRSPRPDQGSCCLDLVAGGLESLTDEGLGRTLPWLNAASRREPDFSSCRGFTNLKEQDVIVVGEQDRSDRLTNIEDCDGSFLSGEFSFGPGASALVSEKIQDLGRLIHDVSRA